MVENKEKEKYALNEFLDECLYAFKTIVITSVSVFMVFNFLFAPVTVDGPSMTPTLLDKQWGFSSLLANYIGGYKRFDVVVVHYKARDLRLVKRIVGLPGEIIEYHDDKLYVNGIHVVEDFFDDEFIERQTYKGELQFTADFGPVKLKENEYFVIGDNRPYSTDSRVLGNFKKEDILSKSVLVLWPLNQIHFAGNGNS